MTYRAGVIGCGRIGCGFMLDPLRGPASTHAGAYIEADSVNLVALCDLDREIVERYADKLGVQAYTDYHEMLNCENPDIVSVCTPPETHEEIVYDAALHGVKAIFCEKPIATSLSAAERMVKICAEKGALLIIGHQRRFSSFYQEVARFIQEGNLGGIQQATCYYTAGATNTGSHLFDLLRFFFGEMESAIAYFSPSNSHNPNDPNIDAVIKFAGAPSVVIQACDHEAYALFEINILGTKGRLHIRDGGYSEYDKAVASKRFLGYQELAPSIMPIYRAPLEKPLLQGIDHLAECLKSNQQPVSSGEDGLKALKIIEALKMSARMGNDETASL